MQRRRKWALLALILIALLVGWLLWYWLRSIGVVPVPTPGAPAKRPAAYPPIEVPHAVDVIYVEDYLVDQDGYYVLNMTRLGSIVVAYGGEKAEGNATVYPAAVSVAGKTYAIVGLASYDSVVNTTGSGWRVYADSNGGYVYDAENSVIWCLDFRGSYSTDKGTIYVWTPSASCPYVAKYVITIGKYTGTVFVNGQPVQVVSVDVGRWGGWLATWIVTVSSPGTYKITIS